MTHRPALALILAASAMPALAAPDAHPRELAGLYDGGQTEVAAMLELAKDGQFRYALSYGALDEMAAGLWHAEKGTVVLEIRQFESNNPYGDGSFGPSVLVIEDGALMLARHDRSLRFRKR